MIHHFYHLYADGAWVQPLEEHLLALRSLPGDVHVTVGVVGTLANRATVTAYLKSNTDWLVAEYDTGYEQRTLDLLSRVLGTMGWAVRDEDQVLYAHSKGAGNPSPLNDSWRGCMTRHLITDPGPALAALAAGADTVGCHWLTPEDWPRQVQIPFYGGNFWWASPAHLRRLPPPSHESRWHAEAWLGTVRPSRPVDLMPGWPGVACRTH